MTTLKIRTLGDALGIILPSDILKHLNAEDGDELFVSEASDGSIRLTARDPDIEEQMKAARKGMDQYRNALRELAK